MERLWRQYPDWKAPAEDGKLIIWPQARHLPALIQQNQKLLSSADNLRFQHVPISTLCKQTRELIGHEPDSPLIATGHQTELYHPGVWVKNVLIHTLAARLGGGAFHIAVDTDSPKHLHLRWPGESVPITDNLEMPAAWTALLLPPSPRHLDTIHHKLQSAGWNFTSVLAELLQSLRRLSEHATNLPTALANAAHELDWRLGLRHHVRMASLLWTSQPFLVFVHHLLARADQLAQHYNQALAAYRTQYGINSRTRPMPDLFAGPDGVEVPFWLDDLHRGQRYRPTVFRNNGNWILKLVGGEEFVFEQNTEGFAAASKLQSWLSQTRYRLSPRALTLTMFVRLALADLFVHGIGGGRYDQVADLIIASFFGIEPPVFAVTTATLYFPPALAAQRVCVPCVVHEGHQLKHSLLGQRKMQLVRQIETLPRHSPQRHALFLQMHSELAAEAAKSQALAHWRQKLQRTLELARQQQALFDRELFYAIQPRHRLEKMIESYQAELG